MSSSGSWRVHPRCPWSCIQGQQRRKGTRARAGRLSQPPRCMLTACWYLSFLLTAHDTGPSAEKHFQWVSANTCSTRKLSWPRQFPFLVKGRQCFNTLLLAAPARPAVCTLLGVAAETVLALALPGLMVLPW